MEFGPRFKKLLEQHGITQKKFAEDTGTHQGQTSRYLRGDESPSSEFIFKAIKYFPEVDANYFFKDNAQEVNEDNTNYLRDPFKIIDEIESKIKELRAVMPQK